ncbi:MAG TPA: hypothetical protein VFA20_07975 [Myxococcaceae bacterium]|nr:hypothetical protein [Myxococcaceae bacterium]
MKLVGDIDLDDIRKRWVAEGSESDLGLWWLADDVREILGADATEDEVRVITLRALRPLLESGTLRAVNLLEGGKFEMWPGDVDEQLDRIAEGWRATHDPGIGDVVWFIGPRG